jgi:hypothetical protein
VTWPTSLYPWPQSWGKAVAGALLSKNAELERKRQQHPTAELSTNSTPIDPRPTTSTNRDHRERRLLGGRWCWLALIACSLAHLLAPAPGGGEGIATPVEMDLGYSAMDLGYSSRRLEHCLFNGADREERGMKQIRFSFQRVGSRLLRWARLVP